MKRRELLKSAMKAVGVACAALSPIKLLGSVGKTDICGSSDKVGKFPSKAINDFCQDFTNRHRNEMLTVRRYMRENNGQLDKACKDIEAELTRSFNWGFCCKKFYQKDYKFVSLGWSGGEGLNPWCKDTISSLMWYEIEDVSPRRKKMTYHLNSTLAEDILEPKEKNDLRNELWKYCHDFSWKNEEVFIEYEKYLSGAYPTAKTPIEEWRNYVKTIDVASEAFNPQIPCTYFNAYKLPDCNDYYVTYGFGYEPTTDPNKKDFVVQVMLCGK